MHRARIKICGITNLDDALKLSNLGIGALGFVLHPASPRFITTHKIAAIVDLLPPFIQKIGVFVDQPVDELAQIMKITRLNAAQLHGNESAAYSNRLSALGINWYKAIRVKAEADLDIMAGYRSVNFLIDSWHDKQLGGTGQTLAWSSIKSKITTWKKKGKHIILAGGLNEKNVKTAIKSCNPSALDVSSGLEDAPGQKNIKKAQKFIAAVEACD